jgi:hypothetical protein
VERIQGSSNFPYQDQWNVWLVKTRYLFTCMLLGFMLTAVAVAQNGNGEIQGTVKDTGDAVVVGAAVTLTNTQLGTSRKVTTDANGHYEFPALPPGSYSVQANAPNFAPLSVTGLVLTLGQIIPRDLVLSLGTVSQELSITGAAPMVNTSNVEISNVVAEQQLQMLPVNSRQYLSLALLMPGTTQDGTRAFFTTVLAGAGVTFNSTGYIADGTQNNWVEDGEPRQDIPQDAIEEFKIDNAQVNAAYGVSTAGQVEVATKSGTDHIHGDAFEYFRDKVLNARTYYQTVNPDYRRNQFGGSLGGPIWKGKMFYFGAYERTQEDDFYTITTAAPFTVMNGVFASPTTTTLYDFRFDWQINESQSVFVREARERQLVTCSGCGGTTSSSSGYDESVPRDSIVVGHTWIVNPKQVNSLRFQYAWGGYYIGPSGVPTSQSIWTQINQFPAARIAPPRCTATYTFPGLTYGGCNDQVSNESRTEVRDTYGLSKGKHEMQVGVNGDYMPYFYEQLNNPQGTWTFPTTPKIWDPVNNAGATFTAANLGVPSAFTESLPPIHTPKTTHYMGAFFSDNWQAKQRLSVSLGLRWERLYGSSNEDIANNPLGPFPSKVTNPSQVINGAVVTYPGISTYINPNGRGSANNKNFAPRVGVNWDVFGNSKQTIRAGYGIYFGNTRILSNLSEYDNGFVSSVSLTNPKNPPYNFTYPDPFGGQSPTAFINGAAPTLSTISNTARSPYSEVYTLGTQRQLSPNMSLSVDGIYNFTIHDRITVDVNPTTVQNSTNNAMRPNPGFSAVNQSQSISKLKYSALYVKLEKRLSKGTQFLASYTYTRSKDNNPLGTASSPYDLQYDWGTSTNERRHALVLSGSQQLKWGIVGGLVYTLRSQLPYSALAGSGLIIDDKNTGYVPGTRRDDGNRISNDTFLSLVNAWRASSQGLAPISVNQFQTDVVDNVDARLSKTFPIHKRFQLQTIAQAFNALNHTQFGAQYGSGRVTNSQSSQFGEILSARPGRQLEFAATLKF